MRSGYVIYGDPALVFSRVCVLCFPRPMKSAAAKGSELGGAGPPTPMSEWSLSDARQWLTR